MAVITSREATKRYNKAYKLYCGTGATAVYDYALTIKDIEYNHCNPCEADTPTIETKRMFYCMICGSPAERPKERTKQLI